jgi:hypothetical protein
MKKLLFLMLCIVVISCKTTSTGFRNQTASQYGYFAQPTPDSDTLYLIKNDSNSEVVLSMWEKDSLRETKPCIVMVTKNEMLRIKELYGKNK